MGIYKHSHSRIYCRARIFRLTFESINMNNYIELHKYLDERLSKLGSQIPMQMGGLARLHKKAVADGALSRKVEELMSLAFSISIGCEGCIAYHTHDAVQAGATRDELLETIGVEVMMAGGPGSIYGVHALDAIEQFLLGEGEHDG